MTSNNKTVLSSTTYGSIETNNSFYTTESSYNGGVEGSSKKQKHLHWIYVACGILLVGGGILAYVHTQKSSYGVFSHNTLHQYHIQSSMSSATIGDGSSKDEDVATKEHFYHHQIIDHLNPNKEYNGTTTYTQRYYESDKYFAGPGSPIFIIMGGEDPLDGLLYPFVYNNLAQTYHAYTAAIEHRFFGKSMPLAGLDDNTFPDHNDLHQLLTPNQAMLDAVHFIQYKRKELGCHLHRGHPNYCPVISVGGSYPGFLAAVLRLVHSDIVDIGYGSSAPFRLYSHHTDQYAYYDKVTTTAETASPGCTEAVRTTLYKVQEDIIESLDEQLQDVGVTYGICRGSIPAYIQTTQQLAQELMLIIATHFANGNMNYYPPNKTQDFVKGCSIFQNDIEYKMDEDKIKAYLLMDSSEDNTTTCFDMMTELPPGPKGTVSSSDWSGVGAGPEGFYWDFISCQLIPMCGFSSESMFPVRDWNYTWVINHCMNRFDWYPDLWSLQEEFHFDDLSHVTRLLLTNGIVDGWSISSVLDVTSINAPGVKIVNMVNGAHHSDLSHVGPTSNDTPDVKEAFLKITKIIGDWLEEVRSIDN